jgi:hypothetical protein
MEALTNNVAQPEQVCAPKPLSKDKFQRLLAAAWSRVLVDRDQLQMATAMGERDTAAVKRGIVRDRTFPRRTRFSTACAPIRLRSTRCCANTASGIVPARCAAGRRPRARLADLTDVTGDLIRNHGRRSPRETCNLADKLRPIIAEEEAIVREADHLRGLN